MPRRGDIALAANRRFDWRIVATTIVLILALGAAIFLNVRKTSEQSVDVGNSITVDDGDEKINWDRLENYNTVLSDSLTITQAGVYHLTGEIADGLIVVDAGVNDVKLILDNVTINNNSGPAISCYSADTLVIELTGENTLSDGERYGSEYDIDVNGAIYSKADLVFQGDGTLRLTSNYQDAIVGKDDVKFVSGEYIISAKDDAVRGKDSVYIMGGDFVIDAKADGIKSTNETDLDKGFVLIENGNLEISAADDGIKASRELRIDDGVINIVKSYEGLEGQVVAINGGNIKINSNDDGINAGNSSSTSKTDANCVISINAGDIYVNASGDGIDSNGYIYFNGGKVVVDGPTNNGNGPLDSGLGITINGGNVLVVGSNGMPETLGNTSAVNNIGVFFTEKLGAGTVVEIKNSQGNDILSHTSAKSFSYLAAGNSEFILGDTYTIYINGEKYQDFIISDVTTMVGNNKNVFNNGFRR